MRKKLTIILVSTLLLCSFFQLIDINFGTTGQLDLATRVKNVLSFVNLPTPPYGTQGLFAAIPAICNTGNLYFATDRPPGSNLYGCTAGNVWTLLSGGSGNVNITIGLGPPSGACTAGSTWYLDTSPTPRDMWFCDTSGTWQKILSTLNVGDGRLCLPGIISGQACITVPDTAGSPADIRLPITTGCVGCILKTDGGTPQQLSWITSSGSQILSGLFSAYPTCNAQFLYITTDTSLQGICDGANTFWKYKGITITPTVIADLPTWFNQGSAFTTSFPGSWDLTSDNVSDNRGRYKTLPTAPYSLVTCLEGLSPTNPTGGYGMFWTDGTQIITAYNANAVANNGPVLRIDKWTNHNTFSAPYISTNNSVAVGGTLCMALIDDTTNRKIKISADKKRWFQLHTVGNTDFFTATGAGVLIQGAGTNVPANVNVVSVETLNSAL